MAERAQLLRQIMRGRGEVEAPGAPVARVGAALDEPDVVDSLDALAARTGFGPADLGVRLLELELAGQVVRLPGQLFQRRAGA